MIPLLTEKCRSLAWTAAFSVQKEGGKENRSLAKKIGDIGDVFQRQAQREVFSIRLKEYRANIRQTIPDKAALI